ncbi:hypothetical protein [Lacipirellula sp.]|uniref:hypothetical protein n=1 Tax=Lacipirellula sp. TaxID=2691419 RepID=UPI003D0B300C
MASITLCPRCSSHLELPAGLTPTSLVECPICEAEFLLASVAPRAIPKVRLVEQDIHHPSSESDDELMDESTPTREPLGIIVDDDMATEPDQEPVAESTDDKLSRLLRSTSSWQLPGAPSPEAVEQDDTEDAEESTAEVASFEEFEAEIDDRIIPNDHAPRPTFGATLDAAYRDADPETAQPAATAADELKLGGSRLDQLLSDLMKTPPAPLAAATPAAGEDKPAEPVAASPTFAEFESDEQTAEELEPANYAEVAEAELAEYDAVDDDSSSDDAGSDESFEDRWRRVQATNAATEVNSVTEEYATDDYAEAEAEDDAVTYEASAEAENEQWTSDEEFDELERSAPKRRKRRPSVVKTLVGVVGGGFIGIFLAGYALLWLKGPDGDLLGIANLLPASMLPGGVVPASQEPLSIADDHLPAPAPVDAAPLAEAAAPLQPPSESTLDFADESQPPTGNELAATDAPAAAEAQPDAPAATMHRDAEVMPTAAVEPVEAIHWPTTPIVGELKGVSLFSVDDLSSHIASADAAHRTFLAGDLARKEDVAAMGQAYIELCKLAERFTLTDPKEFGNDLVTKQMAAKLIFRGAVGDSARRNDLAMIAGRWLEHPRRPNQGVLLLGRVTDLQPQGKWTEYTIETPLGSTVSVNKVLMDKITFKFGEEVAVVGAIVANPSQAIAGYTGDAKQVVVAGFAFAPEDFVAPRTGATADLFTP